MGRKKIKTTWEDLSQIQRDVLSAMRNGDTWHAKGKWCVTLQALNMMGYVNRHLDKAKSYIINIKGLELVNKFNPINHAKQKTKATI